MAHPRQFAVVAPLAPLACFRRALAVEGERERVVKLSLVPPEVSENSAARAALVARVGAAGALRHPHAAAALGVVEVEGGLAVVEEHRPGTSLRALLDVEGRLPADVAARAILDAAEGLARAHALDIREGARLAHGALDPSAIVVGEDGRAFVSGLGLAAGDAAADLRALGAILYECIGGASPDDPPRRLAVAGVPAALAATVDRATRADGPPFPTVAAFSEALAGAIVPATQGELAAYAEAVLPRDGAGRAELRRALAAALGDSGEVSAELLPAPTPPPVGPASSTPPDAVRTFAAPSWARAGSRLPLALGAAALVAGFAAGYALERAARPSAHAASAPLRSPRPALTAGERSLP